MTRNMDRSTRSRTWLSALLALCAPAGAVAQTTTPTAAPSDMLVTLRPGHPRLIVLNEDLARIRQFVADHPDARAVRDELRKSAEEILEAPTVVHALVGPRLLHQSRTCLSRVYTLALLYRLDGDARFARRAEKEMLAAAAFPDWNPRHFLDTAEMTHALAIGYDWLYDALPDVSRRAIRTAIVEKGLNPGAEVYRRRKGWPLSRHNWNQVCNGGMAIGALAVADEEPQLAASILHCAGESIRLPTARLKPDGGWDEGPGYWNYAMSYTAYYLAAMRTALGTDFGLSKSPGLAETGLFRIHSIGPIGLTFNYADAGAGAGNAPAMLFFARLFDRPVYAWHQRTMRRGASALDLAWYDPRGTERDGAAIPLDVWFRNISVVFLRGEWGERQATYVAFKGGDNKANHSHLDLGTFVLDSLGTRWAFDIGPDDYNLPAYFGAKRWTYYRLRTEGHNTLVINGRNQAPDAEAPIVAFSSTPARASAVADLTTAYRPSARCVRRGVALIDRRQVLVQDEIEADAPVDLEWVLHTEADVAIDGRSATLTRDGQRMHVQIAAAADAELKSTPVRIEPPQRPLKGARRLMLRLRTAPPMTRIAVLFTPVERGKEPPHGPMGEVVPLASWPGTRDAE